MATEQQSLYPQHSTCRLALGACCTDVMDGVYTLLVASETVERDGAFPWHCSLLWVMKAGSELNCFLHFPQRNTSSSSAIKRTRSLPQAFFCTPQGYTKQPQPQENRHLLDLSISRPLSSGEISCKGHTVPPPQSRALP